MAPLAEASRTVSFDLDRHILEARQSGFSFVFSILFCHTGLYRYPRDCGHILLWTLWLVCLSQLENLWYFSKRDGTVAFKHGFREDFLRQWASFCFYSLGWVLCLSVCPQVSSCRAMAKRRGWTRKWRQCWATWHRQIHPQGPNSCCG